MENKPKKHDNRGELHRLQEENKRIWAGAKELQSLVESVMACTAMQYGEDVTVGGKPGKQIVLPAPLIRRELGTTQISATHNENGDYVIFVAEAEHDGETE